MPHPRNRFRALVVAATAIAVTLTAAPAAHATPSKADLTKQIDAASKELDSVVESYDAANVNLKKTVADLKTLQASLAPAQAALKTASAQVNTIATTSYMQGRAAPMAALLGGDSDDLMTKMTYLDQIQTSNQRDVDTYTQTTLTFAQRQAALKTTQAKEQAQVQALATKKAAADTKLKKLKTLLAADNTSASATGSRYTGPIPSIPGSAGTAVSFALNQVGDAYVYGAAGPNSWDCSGLTMMAWAAAGYSLPHSAAMQWEQTAHISRSSLKPGDLIYYDGLGHVGIYVGGGYEVDAARPGEGVVRRTISAVGLSIYGYGRVT